MKNAILQGGHLRWFFQEILFVASIFMVLLFLQVGVHDALAAKAPETIMRANCASCHGQYGEGGYPSWIEPSQESMRIAGRSKSSIKKWAREGRLPEMPAFPAQEISDAELDDLATYVNGLPGSFIPEPTPQTTVTITDEDPWYNPMQIQVNVGDTVKFVNMGKTYHPVTEAAFVVTKGASGTDSGLLGPNLYGGGVYFRKFDTAGEYLFLCKIHPYMEGTVSVGQAPTDYPSVAPWSPKPLPTVSGEYGSEIWVMAQFQDYPGKAKDGVIQVIDAFTWNVTNMIPVGNNPHNLWFNKDDTRAVVTNWYDNYVSVINATTKAVDSELITGATNAHVISNFDGTRFYVTIEGSHYIESINPTRWRRVASDRMWVTGYGPHGIWYGGGRLLTANSLDHTASLINVAKETELARLDAGTAPLGAGLNSTGTKGYVGNAVSGDVSIYDFTGTPYKIKDLYIGGIAVQSPVSPDDRYVVVPHSPNVSVIDTATDTVVAQFLNVGKGAHGAAYGKKSTGGYYAYISHKFENYISVIDMDTLTHVGDVPLNTTTTGKYSLLWLVGKKVPTDTGGNGISVRPNPYPWQ